MTRAKWAVAAAAGISLAAGVGCYSPPQYGPPAYGYPTAPQAFPASPGFPAAPGGQYIVPGNTMPGMLGAPATIPGTGSGPTLAPPINSNDAPPYNTYENNSGTPAGPSVPNYSDPQPEDFNGGDFDGGGFGADPGAGTTQPPDDGFQPPASGGDGGSPFMEEGAAIPRRLGTEQVSGPSGGTPDYFAGLEHYRRSDRPAPATTPVIADAGVRPAAFEDRPAVSEDFGFDPITTPDDGAANAGDEDGFGYDASGYRWLRGVVDYDPTAQNWHIIYGLPPDPADRFGGSLTLADNGHFAEFQDNDVVYVQGRVDSAAGRDPLGKPLFRVTSAELIGRFEP